MLGGFYIVNVGALERAQELAAKIPGAKTGRSRCGRCSNAGAVER